jgi:hypothetical protein
LDAKELAMEISTIVLLVVGFSWMTICKMRALVIMVQAEPEWRMRNLVPPFSLILLVDHWDQLRLPTMAGIPGFILFVWGIVRLI